MARIPAGVTELIDLSKIGGFTLPPEIVQRYEAAVAIQKLDLEPLNVQNIDTAAEQIVTIAMRGEVVNLLEIGREIQAGSQDFAAHQSGQMAKQAALDRAADSLHGITANLTETIITEHLRPAYADVLDQARKSAEVVRKHAAVSQRDLKLAESEAVRSVRSALRALEPLAERRSAIAQARVQANRLGGRQPEHDVNGMFAELKTPQDLVTGWSPMTTAQFPYPNVPTDLIERLTWLVTDGAAGQPWCPSVAEQDRCWLDLFGEKMAKLKAGNAGWARIVANG